MTEYAIQVQAKITARNFDSAQTKAAALQEKLERYADWTEVRLVGKENDGATAEGE